ncbi:MAG: hypothetical protein IPG99_02595 [Ignavibacteria bacterium]|nr:hypothetical protein [Ignavibacteria bacterium]
MEGFNLSQNYPNPFNPLTVIAYYVPQVIQSEAETVTDALGKQVAVLVNEVLNKEAILRSSRPTGYHPELTSTGLRQETLY